MSMGSHKLPDHGFSRFNVPQCYHPAIVSEWLSHPAKMTTSSSTSSLLPSQLFGQGMTLTRSTQDFRSAVEDNAVRRLPYNSLHETGTSSSRNFHDFAPEIPGAQLHLQSVLSGHYAEMKTLEEIETILMSPDTEEATTSNCHENKLVGQTDCSRSRLRPWKEESVLKALLIQQYFNIKSQKTWDGSQVKKCLIGCQQIRKKSARGLLIECAEAISENRFSDFEILLKEAEAAMLVCGNPMQRLGPYFLEGLKARQEAASTTFYQSLGHWEPNGSPLLSHIQILYDICPYFKFGYMAANGAIAEAIRNEDHIHIIDFQISQGTQWLTLIQALAARPGRPPHVRITGINDPISRPDQGDFLKEVEATLMKLSKQFSIPLQFHAMPVYAVDVTQDMLDIRSGEAVVVNFTLQLHHVPDESVDVNNPRDGLLRMVKGLSPKVTTLVEQESNMNTTPFLTRFMEALEYYHAIFESIDETVLRDHKDRINVEKHCLGKEIVNIIAREGRDRVARPELLGKWKSRLSMAGFKPYPLSSYVNSVIRSLLTCYSEKYTLLEKDGVMLLGWKDRHLISASAWH